MGLSLPLYEAGIDLVDVKRDGSCVAAHAPLCYVLPHKRQACDEKYGMRLRGGGGDSRSWKRSGWCNTRTRRSRQR